MSGLITEGLGESAEGVITGFQVKVLTPDQNLIVVSFTDGLPPTSLTGPSAVPSNWVIAGTASVTVTAVAIVAATVVLTTTNQTDAASYVLTIPLGIEHDGIACLGPFSMPFTGVATTPAIAFARPIDADTVDVTFTRVPDPVLVMDPDAWAINNGLVVSAVKKITDTVYELTCSDQSIGVTYIITWPVE